MAAELIRKARGKGTLMLALSKSSAERFLRECAAITRGLRIKVYEEWRPELDEVLASLPGEDIFPHELFRSLMKLPNPGKKLIIRVMKQGEPVALAGLRKRWGLWEPVTRGIVPEVLFPVKEGYLSHVLPAFGLPLNVQWWRRPDPPPMADWMRQVESFTDYRMGCSDDFEAHWRKSNLLRKIKNRRTRCCGFKLKVNLPYAAKFIIKTWDRKWRGVQLGERSEDITERLMAAEYLQERGLHYSLLLVDRDEPVAGCTCLVHRNEVLAHISYRNPAYDMLGGMTHFWEMFFYWARDMGFDGICLGAHHDYKKKWAPESGQYFRFKVYPGISRVCDLTSRLIETAGGKLPMGIKTSLSGSLR